MNSCYINSYKTPYTPMEEGAVLLTFYHRRNKETGFKEERIATEFGLIDLDHYYFQVSNSPTRLQSLIENRSRKYIKTYSDFLLKWNKMGSHFAGHSKPFVFDMIKYVIGELLQMDPQYLTFNLTEDGSVFFQSMVNEHSIYFELFFIDDMEERTEAITNIYKDGKSIFAYGGKIDEAFSKINAKLSRVPSFVFEPTSEFYDLSRSTAAQTTF